MTIRSLPLILTAMIAIASPGSAAVDIATESSTGTAFASTPWFGNMSATDLIDNSQLSLLTATVTPPFFGPNGTNDGLAGPNNTTQNAFLSSGADLASSFTEADGKWWATYDLDVSTNTLGYDITTIETFMGWQANSELHANQSYSVEVRTVGSGSYAVLTSVSYTPFPISRNGTDHESHVTITEDATGILATGVDSIRFKFDNPGGGAGSADGSVIREIDVHGVPTGVVAPSVGISSPTARQIVQRRADDLADIEISGTFTGTPDEIEARVVVMAGGGNSGRSIDWEVIDFSPSGGNYSGALLDIPAGGWYQLEVRGVVGGFPGTGTVLERIGVGDIYVTAGQSNSANFGGPPYTPSDDRVSVRTAVSGANWIHAADPMPIAGGTGGSPWSRLGDELAAADDIPIGFLCVGVGGSALSSWQPGAGNYDSRLKPAIQSFPADGFRAVLWHQGESDSLGNVTAATHENLLNTMIAQSRVDAGWDIPWGLAEVSFHNSSHLSQEEPVAAGQRMAVHGDPLIFLGPSTDEFHLEDAAGGKLSDGVHFNAAGLLDHAQQWRDILRGTPTLAVRNGNIEDNREAAITGLSPLADGASHVVDISTDNDSPSVLGWRILSAAGTAAADGSNGFHNPTTGTYAGAIDSTNNGELPRMDGRHVAVLDGGRADNHFLHSTRALLEANTPYSLTVALGVRDNPATFGGARIDLLANGVVVATGSFDKAALDALQGGDSSGTFTDANVSWTAGDIVDANQPLAVRIAKIGGAGTVLDFDNVRLFVGTGSVAITSESSNDTAFAATSWAANLSSTDLVDNSQSSLLLATVTTPYFGPNGTNDGLAGPNNSTENTFFSANGGLQDNFIEAGDTAWATYDLDVSTNKAGYDITSIETFMGWQTNSGLHGNQNYTVEVSTVGSPTYTTLAAVAFSPFPNVDSTNHESHVTITDVSTGILATGVDSIRFILADPGLGGTAPGTVIREIDVHGVPSAAGSGTLSLEALGFGISAPGAFDMTAGGLDTLKTYILRRSQTLTPGSWSDVGSSFTPTSTSRMVSDPSPLTGEAYYRVEETP